MPVLSWAYQPDKITSLYEYDPAKAEQLLDEAGWAEGRRRRARKDGKQLAFEMYTYSGDKIIEGYASVFQENWKAIGVTMTPKYEEFSAFVTRLTKTFDFQTFLVGFFWNVDPDQQTMWTPNSTGRASTCTATPTQRSTICWRRRCARSTRISASSFISTRRT